MGGTKKGKGKKGKYGKKTSKRHTHNKAPNATKRKNDPSSSETDDGDFCEVKVEETLPYQKESDASGIANESNTSSNFGENTLVFNSQKLEIECSQKLADGATGDDSKKKMLDGIINEVLADSQEVDDCKAKVNDKDVAEVEDNTDSQESEDEDDFQHIDIPCLKGFEKDVEEVFLRGRRNRLRLLQLYKEKFVHPLHLVCRCGRFSMIEDLLNSGFNPNELDCYNDTALIAIIECDPLDPYPDASLELCIIRVLEMLIDAGGDIDFQSAIGSPLHTAIKYGYEVVAQFLVDIGIDIDAPNGDRLTALHLATEYGNVNIVEYLVKAGANVLAIDGHGRMPIHSAAKNGYKDIVKCLLFQGRSEIRIYDFFLRTPLCHAVMSNNPDMVKYLIKVGAKAFMVNEALHDALKKGCKDSLMALLEHDDVDVDYVGQDGCSFFWVSIYFKMDDEFMTTVLQRKPTIDAISNERVTPLMVAISNGNFKLAKVLILKGASLNCTDVFGRTPLYVMIEKIHVFEPNNKDEKSETHMFETLRDMLRYGADVDEITHRETPWNHLCAYNPIASTIIMKHLARISSRSDKLRNIFLTHSLL